MKNYFAFIFLISQGAWAASGQTSRGVGSGLAFAPPSYSTVVNPAAVVSAPAAAIAASYRTEVSNPFVSFVGSTGFFGLGATYRQEGLRNSATKSDVVEAAFAARLLFLTLGATARKIEEQQLNYDGSVMLDLGPLRVGAMLRDFRDAADRADFFAGIKLANVHLEFNAKKPRPFDGTYWLLDTGLAFITPDFSVAVGYDVPYYESKAGDGHVHAGLSVRAMENLFLEGMYRPFAQEWTTHDWLIGARIVF